MQNQKNKKEEKKIWMKLWQILKEILIKQNGKQMIDNKKLLN